LNGGPVGVIFVNAPGLRRNKPLHTPGLLHAKTVPDGLETPKMTRK
jgi:hypothetical protein